MPEGTLRPAACGRVCGRGQLGHRRPDPRDSTNLTNVRHIYSLLHTAMAEVDEAERVGAVRGINILLRFDV